MKISLKRSLFAKWEENYFCHINIARLAREMIYNNEILGCDFQMVWNVVDESKRFILWTIWVYLFGSTFIKAEATFLA